MKRIFFLIFIIVSLTNCQSGTEKQLNEAYAIAGKKQVNQYQQTYNYIQHAPTAFQKLGDLPLEVVSTQKTGIDNILENIKIQKAFIAQSGIPADFASLLVWIETHPQKEVEQIYQDFSTEHQNSPYIEVFKRYAAVVLLKDYALLANTQDTEKTLFYIEELLKNGFSHAAFSYHCLAYAKKHTSEEKCKAFAQQFWQNVANSERLKEEKAIYQEIINSEQNDTLTPNGKDKQWKHFVKLMGAEVKAQVSMQQEYEQKINLMF